MPPEYTETASLSEPSYTHLEYTVIPTSSQYAELTSEYTEHPSEATELPSECTVNDSSSCAGLETSVSLTENIVPLSTECTEQHKSDA